MLEFKCINLLKNRNIAKILSAGLAVAVLCSVMAIPVSAAETEWVEVTLSVDDLYNMFSSTGGISNASFTFSHAAAPVITVYDLINSTSLSTAVGSSSNVFVSKDENQVYFFFPYLITYRMMSGVILNYSFNIELPFPYRLNGSEVRATFPIGTPDNELSNYSFNFVADIGSSVSSFQGFRHSNTTELHFNELWDFNFSSLGISSNLYKIYYNTFPYVKTLSVGSSPITEQSLLLTEIYYNPLTDVICEDISFSFSLNVPSTYGTGDDYIQVPSLCLKPITVLVPQEIASDVNEYLDIIAGKPSTENQNKINDLQDKFDAVDDELDQAATDLEVDVPDISDVEATIPEELTQGNEIVSQQVLSPILNAQPIATIFLGLFAIVSLKLFLFGSGPH